MVAITVRRIYNLKILTTITIDCPQHETRSVHHFHCISWEDKSLPIHGASTLSTFHRKVRAFDAYSKGPMVVHCRLVKHGRSTTDVIYTSGIGSCCVEHNVSLLITYIIDNSPFTNHRKGLKMNVYLLFQRWSRSDGHVHGV